MRLNLRKSTPLESSLEFLDSQNYENAVEHPLIWARKIHDSVLYQALFCFFFNLPNNEEGPGFVFLDSLNLYKKEGREIYSCFLHRGSKSCLLEQSTSFESINSWVSVFDFISIHSFLLLQLASFPIIWGICQCLLHCRFVSKVS